MKFSEKSILSNPNFQKPSYPKPIAKHELREPLADQNTCVELLGGQGEQDYNHQTILQNRFGRLVKTNA